MRIGKEFQKFKYRGLGNFASLLFKPEYSTCSHILSLIPMELQVQSSLWLILDAENTATSAYISRLSSTRLSLKEVPSGILCCNASDLQSLLE